MADHTESLLGDYPTRAFAIQPAIEAHRRGEYALSVPVFFAQSDGIVFDGLAKYIFQKNQELRDFANAELARIASGTPAIPYDFSLFMEIMWRHFADPLPVGYNEKARSTHGYSGLNRHTVLHGIALAEYATEENSLKAFSLLSYVAALMSQRQRKASCSQP